MGPRTIRHLVPQRCDRHRSPCIGREAGNGSTGIAQARVLEEQASGFRRPKFDSADCLILRRHRNGTCIIPIINRVHLRRVEIVCARQAEVRNRLSPRLSVVRRHFGNLTVWFAANVIDARRSDRHFVQGGGRVIAALEITLPPTDRSRQNDRGGERSSIIARCNAGWSMHARPDDDREQIAPARRCSVPRRRYTADGVGALLVIAPSGREPHYLRMAAFARGVRMVA